MDLPRAGLLSVSLDESVPLKKIDIDVSIQGFIANVKAELHYINHSDENLETKFMFPMDSDSAIYRFEAEIEGRTIVAEVQEKWQAKSTYSDAIDHGHTAMYMAEEDYAGDLFCMKLGNLPAKTAAKLSFAYIQELDLSRDQIGTFMLPTVINPRYMPDCTPTDEQIADDNIDENAEGMSACAQQTSTLESDDGTLYCSDFTIHLTIHIAGGKNLTVFKNKMELEVLADIIGEVMTTSKKLNTGLDFSVAIHYKGFDKPRAVVESGKKDSRSVFLSSDILMASFVPEVEEPRDMSFEYVFLIDRSGSMNGDRIEKAKETLLLLLKSLPVNCIFNIVSFGSTYKSLFSKSKKYNEENLQKALDLQKKMRADMGGTEIFKPLENIFTNKPSSSHFRQIFLMTDGMVSNVPKIVDLVRKQKKTRIFTFGIGDGCSTELIRDVAKASNGKPTFVKDKDRLQSKVMSALRSSMTCGITDVTLDWNLPQNCSVINVPEKVPTLFPSEKNILYAIITEDTSKINQDNTGKCSLKLSGKVDTVPVNFEVELDFNSKMPWNSDDSLPLHILAAKLQMSEMEIRRADKNQITALSVDVNIPCAHTAFVGVDKEKRHLIVGLPDPKLSLRACGFLDDLCSRSASFDLMPASTFTKKTSSRLKSGLKGKIFDVFFSKKKKSRKSLANSEIPICDNRAPVAVPRTAGEVMCSTLTDDDEDEDEDSDERASLCKEGHALSKISHLVEKQNFNGFWKLDESLCEILDKPLHKIKEAAVVKDMEVWITAMVVAFFRKEYAKQKTEWEMIEEKALQWLKTRDLEEKDVIQEALTFLSS